MIFSGVELDNKPGALSQAFWRYETSGMQRSRLPRIFPSFNGLIAGIWGYETSGMNRSRLLYIFSVIHPLYSLLPLPPPPLPTPAPPPQTPLAHRFLLFTSRATSSPQIAINRLRCNSTGPFMWT